MLVLARGLVPVRRRLIMTTANTTATSIAAIATAARADDEGDECLMMTEMMVLPLNIIGDSAADGDAAADNRND